MGGLRASFVLLALVALAAAGGFVTLPPSAESGDVAAAARGKFVTHSCTNSTKRPKRIIIACGDGNAQLRRLRWRTWGGPRAGARGRYLYNTCRPDCARGDIKTVPARARLSRARPCADRNGALHYRRVRVRFPRQNPPNYGDSERFRLFCPF